MDQESNYPGSKRFVLLAAVPSWLAAVPHTTPRRTHPATNAWATRRGRTCVNTCTHRTRPVALARELCQPAPAHGNNTPHGALALRRLIIVLAAVRHHHAMPPHMHEHADAHAQQLPRRARALHHPPHPAKHHAGTRGWVTPCRTRTRARLHTRTAAVAHFTTLATLPIERRGRSTLILSLSCHVAVVLPLCHHRINCQ